MISLKLNLTKALANHSSRSAGSELSTILLQLLSVSVIALQRPNVVKMQRYLELHALFLPAVQNWVSGTSPNTEIMAFCMRALGLLLRQHSSLHAPSHHAEIYNANSLSSGTTSDFCSTADLCQNNCFEPTKPSCSSNNVLKK